MRLSAPGVRIVDVETCDFDLMPAYDTEAVLRAAFPASWRRYLESEVSRKLLAELGVERRYLTHLPGTPADPTRLTARDLARSAVERLMARRPEARARLDALLFVSTSNPNPCNSQAALLASEVGLSASCLDLKAGCSGGVLGLMQAALLIGSGCNRVLVVMAENLSQLTPASDLRMSSTVGDGAACVLLERHPGPGFLAMVHGTAPEFARTMTVRAPFPPVGPDTDYTYQFEDVPGATRCLQARWRSLSHEVFESAGLRGNDLARLFAHQTHRAQLDQLVRDIGVDPARAPSVVGQFGNMGAPTAAVALARGFESLVPGDRYALLAVGGGISWCGIAAEHR